jgi:magnesium chelatase subunit H
MTPAATSPVKRPEGRATPVRVVFLTLDRHLTGLFQRAEEDVRKDIPGLELRLHAATDWADDPGALQKCLEDIATGDIIVMAMLFIDEQIRAVLPALEARRDHCDAMVGLISAGEIIKLTRLGGLKMDGSDKGPMALLKRLRGNRSKVGGSSSSGAGQMAMLRRLPKILRFIPGAAQDLRAYFLTMQYWLSGSQDNCAAMVRFLVGRYADGPRRVLRGRVEAPAPREYPELALYHPGSADRIVERIEDLPPPRVTPRGVVGVLVLRSYVLADDTGHYDGVIAALEAKGLRVIPAFASGLDGRPAIEQFFMKDGQPVVDAVLSLAGFSLVGGPAYNDAGAAEEILTRLGVPYITAQPLEFQTLEAWGRNASGLNPVESTIMISIPELDGAVAPSVFGGRSTGDGVPCEGCSHHCVFEASPKAPRMHVCPERAQAIAARIARMVALRRSERAERRLAVVLFNFPPQSGAAGTAAFLSVFASLHNTLKGLADAGYAVDVPETVDALREQLLGGNSARYGTDANVAVRISVDDHIRREPHLAAIEAQWGPAPGRKLTDGRSLFVLGAHFGNVFVGLQPGFGYEGDPMRLLFERGFAPTHAFSAFYRYLSEDFDAHAVLHFGTHGALEFMPGKQVGLTASCWPERLIGDLPNFYLYAANNPSEGALAKRRSAATLISYLTPPVAQSGLYKDLVELKGSIQRWRSMPPSAVEEMASLADFILQQATDLDLVAVGTDDASRIADLADKVAEIEQQLIPAGLHTVGEPVTLEERVDLLSAMTSQWDGPALSPASITAVANGVPAAGVLKLSGLKVTSTDVARVEDLAKTNAFLMEDHEVKAIVRALDGTYVRPAPGGDLVRTPQVLPTGRNLHGFDPFLLPSPFAVREGGRHAQIILDRHLADTGQFPETIAMVLWGSDNLKSEGVPIAQALRLMGAAPRFDGFGRLCGARLIPLAELGRPRVDLLMTLSGIFRDLLALQTRMLAEAAYLCAIADEPPEMNFVRKHALQMMAETGCDEMTAALRVFSNAEGAYGANVNQLIDSSAWTDEDELADAYQARKCFAYGLNGQPVKQPAVLKTILSKVDFAYQNVESVELGVTSIDQYVDTLGGITRAVRRSRGVETPVYIGDQANGEAKVRTLAEQVSLETRTRTLNPKWFEGLLKHGYEGVRQIEASVTTTLGWSATTGQVDPWIYQKISETFVLDAELRARMAELNTVATSRLAKRLLEASERNYWTPDEATLRALHAASDELEDRLEGVPTAA